MQKNRKEAVWLVATFLLLCIVTVYFRASEHFVPSDPFRPPIKFFTYLLLLAIWWSAIRNRVTQRNMRIFLQAEQAFMLIGIIVRFLQDAFSPYLNQDVFIYQNTSFLRLSGYLTVVPLAVLPLLGLFASFGLGKAEEYRFTRKWYCLLIPAGVLSSLALTNDSHCLVYFPLEDAQKNFYFHPNIGLYVIIAWSFSLLVIRIFLIYSRSRELPDHTHLRTVPFLIAVFVLIYSMIYAANSYVMNFELFDYHIFLFYLEAMIWEISILVGMVPANTHYEEVFDRSTVAMQIADANGHYYHKSVSAQELPPNMFDLLKRQRILRTQSGNDLHLHDIYGGFVIWQNDVSQTVAIIDELYKSVEKLKQEGELLRQELIVRSDEASVKEKNRIINKLTGEVGGQLSLLRDMLEKRESLLDKGALFKKICLVGTYIKRRCQLRLVQQSDGTIPSKELELCFFEMAGILRQMEVDANLLWDMAKPLESEFAIFALDAFEFLLEHEDFELQSVRIAFEADAFFSIRLLRGCGSHGRISLDGLRQIMKEDYGIRWQEFEYGYQINVSNGGG